MSISTLFFNKIYKVVNDTTIKKNVIKETFYLVKEKGRHVPTLVVSFYTQDESLLLFTSKPCDSLIRLLTWQ